MHRAGWVIVALSAAACGNKKTEPAPAPAPTPKPAPVPGSAGSGSAAPTPPEPTQAERDKIGGIVAGAENVLGIAAGAMIISAPPAPARKQPPWFLIDEDAMNPYAQIGNAKDLAPIVIALSDQIEIEKLSYDDLKISVPERLPEHLRVEASDDGKTWTGILEQPLDLPLADDVKLLAKPVIPARFVRVTMTGSHAKPGGDPTQELEELRAYGKRITHEPMPSATGTYKIDGLGTVSLTQTGSLVTGCIEHKQTHIAGAFEGRVLRFMLTEPVASDSGPAVMTFGAGRAFYGFWGGGVESHSIMTALDGKKTSDKPGACPAAKPGDPIAAELAATGRARLYGIVFDLESDAIRDDAKPTLERLAAVLKAEPALALRIEGHSDAAATPPHNLILSGKQAAAVKAYLVAAGIAATRLTTKGMGSSEALAPNSTSLGRALNRRIELVKP